MVDQYNRWYPDYPGQQPYQDPAYYRAMAQPAQAAHQPPQAQSPGQALTPPTIRAEIVQVDNLAAIDRCPMAAGTSQMYMTKDEQHIVIRSMLANGQHTDAVYDRLPPEPPAPTLNPKEYVRRDELGALIAEALKAQAAKAEPAKED